MIRLTRQRKQVSASASTKQMEKIYNWILRFYDIPEALDIRDLERWNVALLLFLSGVSSLPVCDEPSASFDPPPPPLSWGPKSKGSSRCLVHPTKKKRKKKKNKGSQTADVTRERQHFRSCVVYIYCRVLLTWHACWNDSQIICISFVYLERREAESTLRLRSSSTGGWGWRLSVLCAKSGTWRTLVTPTAADDALHCPSNLRIGYKHLCFRHPNLIWKSYCSVQVNVFSLSSSFIVSSQLADLRCGAMSSRKYFWLDLCTMAERYFKSIAKAWHYSVLQKFKYCGSRKWLLLQWKAEADCNTRVSRRHFCLENCSPAESFEKKKRKKVLFNFFASEKNYIGVPKNILKEVENASWYSIWVIGSLLPALDSSRAANASQANHVKVNGKTPVSL